MGRKLAIKGHATRGKEVIKILQMLGGKGVGYAGYMVDYYYTIDEYNNIYGTTKLYENIKYKIFTLEEFIEKYPYEVGDKVTINNIKNDIGTIVSMKWDDCVDAIVYYTESANGLHNRYYFAYELKPYKEETMEEKENSVVINIAHNQLEVHSLRFDKTQLVINDEYELKQDRDAYYIVRKKSQYPRTYEECCGILKIPNGERYIDIDVPLDYNKTLSVFTELLIYRDTYWKVAGEQLGLNKSWKPNWKNSSERKYCIVNTEGNITVWVQKTTNKILAFPTKEMRDVFFENFKELIEICKELLLLLDNKRII